MAQSYNPDGMWKPFGAFSMMTILGAGRTVFLKGQVALDESGRVVGKGDMAAQVLKVHQNIQATLAPVGGRMSDVVALTQHTTDIAAFMQTGAIRQQFFAPPYPVTTTIEISSLYDPDLLIEITAIAEIPMDRFHEPDDAKEMHG